MPLFMTVILTLNKYNKTALIHCLIIANPDNPASEKCSPKTGSFDFYQKKASTLTVHRLLWYLLTLASNSHQLRLWELKKTWEEDSSKREPAGERDIQMEHTYD